MDHDPWLVKEVRRLTSDLHQLQQSMELVPHKFTLGYADAEQVVVLGKGEWDSMAEPVRRGYVAPVERTEIDVAQEILATYVGNYRLNDEMDIAVTLEEGTLYVEPTGQGKYPIFAESEVKFFLKVVEAQMTFTKNDAGEVDGMILHQGGQDQRAERIR